MSGRFPISFLNRRFEQWLAYQDKRSMFLSEVLTGYFGSAGMLRIYGLSLSLVRDKLTTNCYFTRCTGPPPGNITIASLVREFASTDAGSRLDFCAIHLHIFKRVAS